jgi:hypothetical protein
MSSDTEILSIIGTIISVGLFASQVPVMRRIISEGKGASQRGPDDDPMPWTTRLLLVDV